MRKNPKLPNVKLIVIFLIICTSFFLTPCAFSAKKKIKLTTTNINKDYKILGFVYYRSGFGELDKINEKLKEQAKKLDANYVIGIGYIVYAGYIYGYGTAVKTK